MRSSSKKNGTILSCSMGMLSKQGVSILNPRKKRKSGKEPLNNMANRIAYLGKLVVKHSIIP